MERVDYIIVGFGIAGASFAQRLLQAHKKFVVFDTAHNTATRVAGGTINPVVLKRFTPVWQADAFYNESLALYKGLQLKDDNKFCWENRILRVLTSNEEQNNWSVASNSIKLSKYMEPTIRKMENEWVKAPFHCGVVKPILQLNTPALLDGFRDRLKEAGQFHTERFEYDTLALDKDRVHYKNIVASKIVFAEGTGALQNPYFPQGILIPKKGEYIILKAEGLQLKEVIKGPFFLIPLENDLYKIGATFIHGDTTFEQTKKSRDQLIEAARKMITCPFQVVDQQVGMRPTVKDRRPLMGRVSHQNAYFFNGLGTRGLFMAPLLSKMLFENIENNEPLPPEVDIKRFSPDRT